MGELNKRLDVRLHDECQQDWDRLEYSTIAYEYVWKGARIALELLLEEAEKVSFPRLAGPGNLVKLDDLKRIVGEILGESK